MAKSPSRCSATRRRFLKATAAAALGGSATVAHANRSSVKIQRIEIFPMRYPTVGYFKFFEGVGGHYGRAAVILKVTADNGVVGWGQSVPVARWSYETLDTSTIVLRDYLAPALVGRDPTDIAGAHKVMDKAIAPAFTTGMPVARAGMDLALHDLVGKLRGQSLAEMWGRPRGGPVRLSWTGGRNMSGSMRRGCGSWGGRSALRRGCGARGTSGSSSSAGRPIASPDPRPDTRCT